jgi:Tfp pilus assembly protein PilN
MDIPVTRWQSRLFPPGDNAVFSYTTAAGLALSGDEGSLAPINLVPNERAELKAAAQKRQQQLLAALVAVVAVIAVVFIVQAQISAQKKQMQEQTRANEQLNEVKGLLTSRQKEYDQVSALDEELRTGLNRSQPTVDVLVALSRCLPRTADIWLTQYGYEKGGQLTLRGETKSALAATDLVIALQSSGNFLDVKLGYLGDSQENTTRRRTNAPTVQDASFTTPATQNPPPPNPGNAAPPPGGMPPPGGPPPGMPSPAPGAPPGLPPMNGVPGPGMAQSGLPPPSGNRRPGNGANAGQNAPVKPNRADGGLTTFTITCRVNPTSKALVPATLEPAKKTEKNTLTKKADTKSSTSEEDTTGGEEDEN